MTRNWEAFRYMLGKILKQKRIDLGITQAELAKKLGVSQRWISKNEHTPSERVSKAIALALSLGVKLSDISNDDVEK